DKHILRRRIIVYLGKVISGWAMLKFADTGKDSALSQLGSSERGLSGEEVAKRQQQYGKNALKEKKRTSVVGLFFSQFGDVMTILLIAAACISAVIAFISGEKSDLADTSIIGAIIFLNAIVGTIQQYRADKAIEGLKKLSSQTARVRRDGEVIEVDATELTVGDIVLLEEGDVVPADMRVISSTELRCDEAALTGESLSVDKRDTVIVGKKVTQSNACNLLFSSTFVVHGSGEGVVYAVGPDTEIGGIAEMLDNVKKGRSPLEKSLNKLGKIISAFVIVVAAIVFAVGFFSRGTGLLKNFMTAVAVAVAAIPEGLPAVVSVIMAMGVQRMSRENVVIRKMKCVETLGGCTCICSDKTGTLTQNKMKVVRTYSRSSGDSTGANGILTACMSICTRVKGGRGSYIGDPTEVAIKAFADESGWAEDYSVTGEIPFTSERKLMSVRAETLHGVGVYVKGAPEIVLRRCTAISDGDGVRAITEADIKGIEAECSDMAKEALRVLAFAYKSGGELSEEGLTFIGLCGMMDDLKEGVREAVGQCREAGVTTVMITGDSAATALAIAKKAGIAHREDEVFTGEQLDAMTKPQLKEAVKKGRVFARVSPKHKNIIVKIKQAQGEVVAMTGDGVNDAPPVKSADIGIVMGKSGTEVTKSVADMVIADDNFTTIVAAVREGRRISSNIKKTIQFFLSTNLAEVLAIMLVTFIFVGCDFLPSTQLLWINLITDSFPVLALGVEKGCADDMKRKPERAEKALFSRSSILSVFISSLFITGVTVGAYAFTLAKYGNAAATTVAFLTLSFAELFHVFNVRSGDRSAVSGVLSNKILLLTVVLGIGVNLALCFSPLAPAFGIAKLSASLWGLVFGGSLSVILFGEIYKLIAAVIRKKAEKSGVSSRVKKRCKVVKKTGFNRLSERKKAVD
ncbi:MAG: cation-translocating P-type ATPase, partial [Clostridia bacterium]|nr:cation-translocating P-type ATPase [Clostridia bacterium]